MNNTTEARLERIESMLSSITAQIDQAPSLLSIAADSVDESIDQAKAKGVDVDERLKSSLHVLKRLSDPTINQSLNNLLDAIEQAPGLISMGVDMVDEAVHQNNAAEITLDDRLKSVTRLASALTDPQTAERVMALNKISAQSAGLVAMTMDSVDAFMERYGSQLSDSLSFLHMDNLMFLKNTGEALTEAQQQPPAKVGGVFGLLRALKDPGRQKALGFLMNVLKNLGNKI